MSYYILGTLNGGAVSVVSVEISVVSVGPHLNLISVVSVAFSVAFRRCRLTRFNLRDLLLAVVFVVAAVPELALRESRLGRCFNPLESGYERLTFQTGSHQFSDDCRCNAHCRPRFSSAA